ncbi:MAG: hypothetical protein JW719_06495 [Pirellulales bacterium]|nr:hypothetical protein [Pirellulales bacterium]
MEPNPPRTEEISTSQAVSEAVVPPRPDSPRRTRDFAPGLFFLLLGYGIVDFLGPDFFRHGGPDTWALIVLWTGAVGGQIAFLATWAAMGPLPLRVRWPIVLAITFMLYFTFLFGLAASEPRFLDRAFAEAAAFSLVFPLMFLLAQSPLWIRRVWSGWRIVDPVDSRDKPATGTRQFGLAHLLVLMASLAVALSLAQLAMTGLHSPRHPSRPPRAEFWLAMGIWGVMFSLYVAVLAGPSLRACFLAQVKRLGCLAMVGVWFGVSIMVVFIMEAVSVLFHAPMAGEIPVVIFLHLAAAISVLFGSLHVLRAGGCRMIRTERKTKLAPSNPFSSEPAMVE